MIIETLLSPLLGGVFAFLNRREDVKVKQMEFEHELKKLDMQAKLMQAEAAIAAQKVELSLEGERAKAIAQVEDFDFSPYSNSFAGKFAALVAALSRIVRPLITIAILAYIFWFLAFVIRNTSVMLTLEDYREMHRWVLDMGGAVVTYWFVGRGVLRR